MQLKISKRELDSKLPDSFDDDKWWLLAPLSNLKKYKRWMRNKRLRKKFCNRKKYYLPHWLLDNYLTMGEKNIESMSAKIRKQLMDTEDEYLLNALKETL